MPRISVKLSKASLLSIDSFINDLSNKFPKSNIDKDWKDCFISILKDEVKSIKDCNENSIITEYLKEARKYYEDNEPDTPDNLYLAIYKNCRKNLAREYTDKTFDNNIDRYFNEVKREYIEHPQNECDSLIFCDDNRDIFIKNNLKLVVNCAKRYQKLGLPFEDLIQAGNEGLLLAFEKFDTNKANLRNTIKKDIDNTYTENTEISRDEATNTIKKAFTYGKLLDQTLAKLPAAGFKDKEEFKAWVMKNVKTAVFASVAFQWIRASILIELTKQGCVIKMPKIDNKAPFSNIVRLDSVNQYTDDCYHDNDIAQVANEEFLIEDNKIVNEEKNAALREVIDNAMKDMEPAQCRIIRKRYGIGLPYSMTVSELAENEKMSMSNIKLILKTGLEQLAKNITPDQREVIALMMED